jgi:hypothetical protein
VPAKDRIAGLCRVVFMRAECKGPGNSPKNRVASVSVGIIRESALWRNEWRLTRFFRPETIGAAWQTFWTERGEMGRSGRAPGKR